MVRLKQGDIIKLNFNPQSGHEQAGYRPALVVSNEVFHQKNKSCYSVSDKQYFQ